MYGSIDDKNNTNSAPDREGVWLVYDGECPLCNMAAHALRIRQKYGSLHLLDARTRTDDPLLREIKNRNLDLDEGMVVYYQERFYHGKDALKFMAVHADKHGLMNHLNGMLFRKDAATTLFYPFMRVIRKALLKIRGIQGINNLGDKPTL